jgi:hypothetical protein
MKTATLCVFAALFSFACSSPQSSDGTTPTAEAEATSAPTAAATADATAATTAEPTAAPTQTAAPAATAKATPPVAPTDKRLIGTWELSDIKLTFNSKGRVKMSISPSCVGSYFIKDETLDVKYDPGASGCSWDAPASFTLKEPKLSFLGAEYKRVDKKDDAAF